ncbi:MAG: pyridoxamine 5'-phosphate oxidase family protein [Dehalococcoidia bacterium]
MPSRRGLIALTQEEQDAFLADSWTLQVASIGPKGYPHLVAMWYVMDRGMVAFTTFRKSQKVLNLQRNAKVSCMLEAGKAYSELRGLVIEGTAEIADIPVDTARIMALVGAKYNGIPAPMETSEQAMAVASKRVVIRVKPDEIYSWDHRKLGGRY